MLRTFAALVALPFLLLVALSRRNARAGELVWGPVPVINNKYWSEALRGAGWSSRTLVGTYYSTINRRDDFDVYFDELVPRWAGKGPLARALAPYFASSYVLRRASVLHMPFSGGPLGGTRISRLEGPLLRLAGVKAVVIPYGSDLYVYRRVLDPAFLHGLLLSYPAAAKSDTKRGRVVDYWTRWADVIIVGFAFDGLSRWDIPSGNIVSIDSAAWRPPAPDTDGQSARPVRVLHAPNHRGSKGTEFIVDAVARLRDEGHEVELVLVERVQNEEIHRLLGEVDIVADQCVAPGYGLAAIEAMAMGRPVVCNLELEIYTRMFRRYSFLDECPVVSASPETLIDVLRTLVVRPDLRGQLGAAGRAYVEKYHSYETAQYLFGSIYRRILDGEDVDLPNLFHPLKSPYNRTRPRIVHPLHDSRLPVAAVAEARTGQEPGA